MCDGKHRGTSGWVGGEKHLKDSPVQGKVAAPLPSLSTSLLPNCQACCCLSAQTEDVWWAGRAVAKPALGRAPICFRP